MVSVRSARVVELTSAMTHDLRARVLRDGTPTSELAWPGDDLDSTVHLGVVISGSADPVAISTWLRVGSPDLPLPSDPGPHRTERGGRTGVQLRGMATAPNVRGHGLGSLLLRDGIERAAHDGADHVWANARSAVLDFYRAHGFEVMSDEFLSTETAIPHHRILRDLRTV